MNKKFNIFILCVALFAISAFNKTMNDINIEDILLSLGFDDVHRLIDRHNRFSITKINQTISEFNLQFYPILLESKVVENQNKLCIAFGSGLFPGQTSLISLFYDFGPAVVSPEDASGESKFINNQMYSYINNCNMLFIDPIPGIGLNPASPVFNSSDATSSLISKNIITELFTNYSEFTQYNEIYFVGTGYTAKIAPTTTKLFSEDESTSNIFAKIKGLFLASPMLHNVDLINPANQYQMSKLKVLYDKNFIDYSTWSAFQACLDKTYSQSPSCSWAIQKLESEFYKNAFNSYNVYRFCETHEDGFIEQCVNFEPILKLIQEIPNHINGELDRPPKITVDNFNNRNILYYQNINYQQTIEDLKYITSNFNIRLYLLTGIQSAEANYKVTQNTIEQDLGFKPQYSQYTINYQPQGSLKVIGCQIAGFAQQYTNDQGKQLYFVKVQKGGYYISHWTQLQSLAIFEYFLNNQSSEGSFLKCAPRYYEES